MTTTDASPPTTATQVCPDCAATVLGAATFCKHCGHRLGEHTLARRG